MATPEDPQAALAHARSGAEEHLASALVDLGFSGDPEMASTPERVAAFLRSFQATEPLPPAELLPTRSADLLVIRDLPYYSLCAHHLLPFFGRCTIAVRPAGEITGFGWFPRVLQHFARQPQLQERLAQQVAEAVHGQLGAHAVGVRLSARQMCVEMRGARSSGEFELTARRGSPDAELDHALR